ncbi:MAG: hypothetical protein NTW50_02375 [Candidatus Berkelbacteria bacterium]|nr:hypothetical protein [Candidatus Berkelbacteria bacterium]
MKRSQQTLLKVDPAVKKLTIVTAEERKVLLQCAISITKCKLALEARFSGMMS